MSPLEARRAVGHSDIVERLGERRKLKYMGNCKCGWCQLVHINDVGAAAAEIERLRSVLRAVRGCSDPAWQVRLINEALGEGETP